MNELAYDVKRAHWGMTCTALRQLRVEAKVRRELASMTPARFEILSTILSYADAVGTEPGFGPRLLLTQIIHKIGLDRSTVARSVRRMEKLGLVKRMPHETRGRCIHVMITKRGLRAMSSARELLALKPNFIQRRVEEWLERLRKIAPRPQPLTQRKWTREARLLSWVFDHWAHPVLDPEYDHRVMWEEAPAKSFPNEPLLPRRAARRTARAASR